MIDLIYGPTKPFQVPSVQLRDERESIWLRDVMSSMPSYKVDKATKFIESVALEMIKQIISESENCWVRAYAFGSSGLAAAIADSDLDMYVGNVHVVAARVPVIKFKFENTSVDIVFVSVALSAPPTIEQLLDDSFLLQVARLTRPSANGLRTILEVKRRLPVAYEVFTTVLKAVKYWAMKRETYGSLYTFPGGVVLAVMVARCCQVMPAAHPSIILRFFFIFYTHWLSRHDKISPIFITTSLTSHGRIPGLPDSWDPQRIPYCEDLIPVINPAYPYVNDARNIGRCGLETFYTEITRAHLILSNSEATLEEIWKPYEIKKEFSTFLLIHVSCDNDEVEMRNNNNNNKDDDDDNVDSTLNIWSSYIASKLRIFIYSLERIVDARPYPHKISDKIIGNKLGSQYPGKSFCYFVIGVKGRNSELKLDKSMFYEAFEEFRYAILKDCASFKNNSRGFQRNERTMHEPWISLVDATQLPIGINIK